MKIKNDTFRTYIVDDDLNAVFSKLPAGVHLEVLLDSCHSGTGTREAAALACLPTEYVIKHRFLIPLVDILCRQADGDDLKLQKIGRADNSQTHVLFAGCKDTQTSADAYISGAYNGAFTYYFCKTLRDDVQDAITRAELLKCARASLKQLNKSFEKIKQEVNMSFSATTISEHYVNEGRIEGETMGEFRGEFRGIIMGKIEMMEELYRFSVLSKEQMEKIIEPLKEQLQDLLSRV